MANMLLPDECARELNEYKLQQYGYEPMQASVGFYPSSGYEIVVSTDEIILPRTSALYTELSRIPFDRNSFRISYKCDYNRSPDDDDDTSEDEQSLERYLMMIPMPYINYDKTAGVKVKVMYEVYGRANNPNNSPETIDVNIHLAQTFKPDDNIPETAIEYVNGVYFDDKRIRGHKVSIPTGQAQCFHSSGVVIYSVGKDFSGLKQLCLFIAARSSIAATITSGTLVAEFSHVTKLK